MAKNGDGDFSGTLMGAQCRGFGPCPHLAKTGMKKARRLDWCAFGQQEKRVMGPYFSEL